MKKIKYIITSALIAIIAIITTACATNTGNWTPPLVGPYAWIYNLFGHPLQNIMLHVSNLLGGTNGAGWAIIIITFVIQLIVLPLRLSSQSKMIKQQEKTKRLQPQLSLIQAAMKKNSNKQMQLSQLQMKIYKDNNMSMIGGMGCLPLLIQLPIMIGIYQAVAYSKTLASSSFMGISLSKPSIVFAVVAAILYLIQGYLSLIGISEQQKQTMLITVIASPLMTLVFSIMYSGALGLYFLVGGIVIVIQQLIATFILMPKVRADVDKELAKHPIKEVINQAMIDQILNESSDQMSQNKSHEITNLHEQLRKRNSGKQNRNK